MFRKIIVASAICIGFSQNLMAQKTGYWDKDRSTTREIIIESGKRTLVKTEDFPLGTTEVVYRITTLDQNQQMANSLVSVLRVIPDPTGISQGSAGAVLLASKVSGDDKCTYAIFSSNDKAAGYVDKGNVEKACLIQNSPVSKDARDLSIDKSTCFQGGAGNMWFGFENKNWFMNQKIVLEVVPWVDYNLSTGWNNENKKQIVSQLKTSDLVKKMIRQDDFCLCVLDKIQKKYRYQEFQKLLGIEKSKAFKDFGNACLIEKPANKTILDNIRLDAEQYFKAKKYSEAISLLNNTIVENGNATVLDYNLLGKSYLFSKQYDKAFKALKEGEKLDSSELLIQLNLAHYYLLTGDYGDAKDIHKKYKSQNVTVNQSWIEMTKSDFEAMKKAGIQSEDFDRILKLFEN